MVSHCACPTRVFPDRAFREHRRPLKLRLDSYHLSKGSIQIVLTARIEGPPYHRGASASKKDSLATPLSSVSSVSPVSPVSPVSTHDTRYRTAQWDSGIGEHLL